MNHSHATYHVDNYTFVYLQRQASQYKQVYRKPFKNQHFRFPAVRFILPTITHHAYKVNYVNMFRPDLLVKVAFGNKIGTGFSTLPRSSIRNIQPV